MPRRDLGGAVGERLTGGVGRAGVGRADAELVVRRVRVDLGGVVADDLDADRLQRRGEVGVLLPGALDRVLRGRRRPAGLRGPRRAGVGPAQLLLAAAGDVGGGGRVTGAVVRQRGRGGGGVGVDQRPAAAARDLAVDLVVGRVADGLHLQGDRAPGRDRDRRGHVGRRLARAGRVGELVGDRVLVAARRERAAGAAAGRLVQVRRVDRGRVAGDQVGEARVVSGHEDLRVLVAERLARVGAAGDPEAAGARGAARLGRRPAGVLVQLRLDVVLRRAAHVQVRGVVGVAQPAEVVGVGLAGGRVGLLELGQHRVGAGVVLLVLDAAAAVEQLFHPEVVRLGPLGRVVDVGRLHPQRVGVAVVDGVVGGVPGVVRGEGVVDVHLDVVAVQAQVHALGDPVDQARGEQQPLGLRGVVVEAQRQLGHPGLRVGARVLVDGGQDAARRVLQPRRDGGPGHGRGRVAVGAGAEGDRALELRQGQQPGGGELGAGAVQRARAGVGQAQGRVRVAVPVDLPDPERRLVAVHRGQLPGGEVGGRVGDDHPVVVALRPAGQRGQGDRLTARRAGRVHLGVGHPLGGQRGRPGRRGRIGGPAAHPAEQ